MSRSTTNSALRVLEQGNLLGGADLVPVVNGGRRKRRTRPFHVAAMPRLGFATALALVVEHGRQKAKERGVTSMSRCPRCGHVGPTDRDFGTRLIRGERRPQSWCRSCRTVHLPPLSASSPSRTSPRLARETPSAEAKVERPARASTAEGWLFPPETLGGAPSERPRKRKGSKLSS